MTPLDQSGGHRTSPDLSLLKPRDADDDGDRPESMGKTGKTLAVTYPDIFFELKAYIGDGDRQSLFDKVWASVIGVQKQMSNFFTDPYAEQLYLNGVLRIGIWLNAPGHPPVQVSPPPVPPFPGAAKVSDFAVPPPAVSRGAAGVSDGAMPPPAISRGAAGVSDGAMPPATQPPLDLDPQRWARGLARELDVLAPDSVFLDFGILIETSLINYIADIFRHGGMAPGANTKPVIPSEWNTAVGVLSLTGFEPILVDPDKVVTKVSGDFPYASGFAITWTDKLSIEPASIAQDGHETSPKRLRCDTTEQVDENTAPELVKVGVEVVEQLAVSFFNMFASQGFEASERLRDYIGWKTASVKDALGQLAGLGSRIMPIFPSQIPIAGTGPNGQAYKVVFDYFTIQVDPQRGILALGSLDMKAERRAAVHIVGPSEIEIPQQHGPTVTETYGITTADMRPPLTIAWQDSIGLTVNSPHQAQTKVTFDVRTRIAAPRNLAVRVTDADGLQAPDVLDVQIDFLTKANDPDHVPNRRLNPNP